MGAQGLPRERRIRKRSDFLRIQGAGVRLGTAHFIFLLGLREDGGPSRLGIVASRKVGNAVARNRAKRLIREAFRRCSAPLPAGLDLVVVARAGADALTYHQVADELAAAVPRICRRAAALARG